MDLSDEILQLPPLDGKQQCYVDNVCSGMTRRQSALAAGYSNPPTGANILKHIALYQAEIAQKLVMGSAEIQAGLLEAIDMAKSIGDPQVMISGWREIAKLLGANAPTKTQVQVDTHVHGQVEHRHTTAKLENMTDRELAGLIGRQTAPIDGEFEEIFGDGRENYPKRLKHPSDD